MERITGLSRLQPGRLPDLPRPSDGPEEGHSAFFCSCPARCLRGMPLANLTHWRAEYNLTPRTHQHRWDTLQRLMWDAARGTPSSLCGDALTAWLGASRQLLAEAGSCIIPASKLTTPKTEVHNNARGVAHIALCLKRTVKKSNQRRFEHQLT